MAEDSAVDGFFLGEITQYIGETEGDGFVLAPDGSRAGLVWEVGEEARCSEIGPPSSTRWGVWAVTFPFPMTKPADLRGNLSAILPLLRPAWEAWRK